MLLLVHDKKKTILVVFLFGFFYYKGIASNSKG